MATRFVTATTSETDSLNQLADRSATPAPVITVKSHASAVNYSTSATTAAEFINGLCLTTGGSTATVTFPTAAQIVAAIPNCQVGSSFEFQICNTNSGNTTISHGLTGVGTSAANSNTIATNKSQLYRCVVTATDTPAVTVYGLLYAVA